MNAGTSAQTHILPGLEFEALRATGRGWQTRVNALLREAVEHKRLQAKIQESYANFHGTMLPSPSM